MALNFPVNYCQQLTDNAYLTSIRQGNFIYSFIIFFIQCCECYARVWMLRWSLPMIYLMPGRFKWLDKTDRENAFERKRQEPWLKFNQHGLALIGLWTNRQRPKFRHSQCIGIPHVINEETRRNLSRVSFRKHFWDSYRGRAGQLLALTVPDVFAKV